MSFGLSALKREKETCASGLKALASKTSGIARPLPRVRTTRAVDAAIRTLPPDVQLQRKMNSADANGPLVPRVRKTSKKRDREEPAAPPAAPPRKRARDELDLDRTAAYLL